MADYIGNNDYRGYLNYLAQKNPNEGIRNAAQLLIGSNGSTGYVNNQGQLSGKNVLPAQIQNLNADFYKNYLGGQAGKLTSSPDFSGIGGTPTVYAPPLDIASINAQARKAAAGAVNPYYTKQLNLFLNRQKELKAQETAQYQTNVKNIEDTLAQNLQGNEINRGRTIEDTAQNVADINQQQDIAQTDQGQQFTQDRLSLAKATAGGGGLSAQKQESLQQGFNVSEQRQAQQVQQAKQQQELFKGRTLSDLLRSDELAKTSSEKGKKQAKFDLDNYIKAQNYEITQTKRSTEKARLADLAQEEARQRSKKVLSFIEGISNPAQKAAAYSTYGAYI